MKGYAKKITQKYDREIFLLKIITEGKEKEFKTDSAERLFRYYQAESLDSELLVITNLDCENFYPNDILKIKFSDKIYFTNDQGWYVYVDSSNLVNIEYKLFDKWSS